MKRDEPIEAEMIRSLLKTTGEEVLGDDFTQGVMAKIAKVPQPGLQPEEPLLRKSIALLLVMWGLSVMILVLLWLVNTQPQVINVLNLKLGLHATKAILSVLVGLGLVAWLEYFLSSGILSLICKRGNY